MPLSAALGQAHALDGREASAQAVRQAVEKIQRQPVILGLLFVSHELAIQQVLGGAATILGNTPLLGYSAMGAFSTHETGQRSVVVALLAGDDVEARAQWWPEYGGENQGAADLPLADLHPADASADTALLLVADGLGGDAQQLCAGLPAGEYPLAGCLAGGDLHRGRTYQIGGQQAGSGGLAAATIAGDLRMAVGAAHGWQPVGTHFEVTLAQGPWIRALDGRPASETYARLFGHQPRDWAFPPLNELIRLYPLGLEQQGTEELLVRSPLRVEADGSLRMSTPVPEGSACHLLVGSADACLQAARQAARQALAGLGDARPILAIVMTDVSWRILMEPRVGSDVAALREVLGSQVPIAGGYCLGQLARAPASGQAELLNQHIEVVLFGGAV